MTLRSGLRSLQLPVAGFGLLVVAQAIHELRTIPEPPPGSDGFVGGLAVFFLGLFALGGFVIAALGFAIPPGDGFGIRFDPWQRRLFVAAALAAVASILAPLVGWSVLVALGLGPGAVVFVWFGLAAVAVLAFAVALGWRIAQAVARRLRVRTRAGN